MAKVNRGYERYSLQIPHGWNKGIIKHDVMPTIDRGIWKHHILLLEVKDDAKQTKPQ